MFQLFYFFYFFVYNRLHIHVGYIGYNMNKFTERSFT